MKIMEEKYELYNGDCLEIMDRLIEKGIKVDMILCDLPYGVTNKKKNKWDSVIPFEDIWKRYDKIIKDNGAIVLFAQDKFTAKLMLSNEKHHRYNLVWKKVLPSGFLNAKKKNVTKTNRGYLCFLQKGRSKGLPSLCGSH